MKSVDFVPPNLPLPNGRACLILLEDNDPVIQICIKGRNPTLRHVARVHRVNTDACYERIREDPGIYMRYWPTKYQLADILTKGSFTKQSWDQLLDLLQIRVNASEGHSSPDRVKQKRPSRAVDPLNITPEPLHQHHEHTSQRVGNSHIRTPSPL